MRPVVNFINQQEIETIHEKALEMLENLGMKFESTEAQEYFRNAGATVGADGIVKIPRNIVLEGLKTAPKRDSFVVYGRTRDKDIRISDEVPYLAAMTMATNVLDIDTGKKRKATNEDLKMLTRMMETLPTIGMAFYYTIKHGADSLSRS